MSLRGWTAFLAAAGWAATGCSSTTEPHVVRATVTVQQITVTATRLVAGTVTWVNFTVPAAIRNDGGTALTFYYCASSIEGRVGAEWSTVWSPICALGSARTVEIAPGETRSITVDVGAAVAGPGGPTWERDAVAGTYRLAVGLVTPGLNGLIPRLTSNPFTLVEESPR